MIIRAGHSSLVALLITIAASLLYALWRKKRSKSYEQQHEGQRINYDAYNDIEPLRDFDWQKTEPLKLRPFKSRYHLTMGLENLTFSDLVAIDKTYLERIKLRRSIMQTHSESTLACNSVCEAAVQELHIWIFGTYLPRRFPSMFKLEYDKNLKLKNLVTNESVIVNESSAMTALRNLGSHVDTDFLLMLPSSSTQEGQPIYHLEAFVTCFPSGFSTKSKLSKPLASIHKPVPGYALKLERSMDRYFSKIECGTIVRRANWTITTTPALFVQAGTHLYSADDPNTRGLIEEEKRRIVIENCRLRAERQTLHRLPKSRALVFAFKTYQYRLEDVKREDDGPALAKAIAGLSQGSVPEMHFYKRGVVWGDIVSQYLCT